GFGVPVSRTRSALDLPGLEARGADIETLRGHTRSTDQSLDPLDVRVPATLGAAVRVRDVVTEARSLAADVAVGRHGYLLNSMMNRSWARGRHDHHPDQGEPVKSSRCDRRRQNAARWARQVPAA